MTARAQTGVGQDLRLLLVIAWRVDCPRLLKTLTLLTINGFTSGAAMLLLAPIIHSLTTGGAPTSETGVLGGVQLPAVPLPTLLVLFVLLTTVQAWVARSAAVTALVLQQLMVDSLRARAFRALLAARWSFVLKQRRSDVVEIVTSGAMRTGVAFQQLTSFAATAVVAAGTAAVAIVVAPVLAGAALVGVAALAVLMARTTLGPAYRLGAEFGTQNRRLQSIMTDSMDSLRLVRVHNAAEGWNVQLGSAFSTVRGVQLANTRRTTMVTAVFSVGLAVCAAALILLAVRLGVSGAAVVTVLVLVSRLAGNVRSLTQIAASMTNALPAVGDLARLTDSALAEREAGAAAMPARSEPDPEAVGPLLEFRGVSYVHPGTACGIFDVDLVVRRGKITVLTGPSGAGKSTTADLALGLLTPDAGEIVVDGAPLREADLTWWRDRVAYVPQETVLIPGSLRENLVWSAGREVSDEECWDALERCVAGFARALPEGLDTLLGHHGLRLSGGERQRVALARAMLRKPLLLVLDEATSSLDDATESAVVDWIGSLIPAVTVLVIAHRRTTIAAADHLVRIDTGRVVEADALRAVGELA